MALVRADIRNKFDLMYKSLEYNDDATDAREKLLDGMTDILLYALAQADVPVTITTVGSATTQTGFVTAKII